MRLAIKVAKLPFLSACIFFSYSGTAAADPHPHLDPLWTPNPITGLPPALYPAGWYVPGFGAYFGVPAHGRGLLYACRAHSPYPGLHGWHYGHAYAGACHFPHGGSSHFAFHFDYLSGARAYRWTRAYDHHGRDWKDSAVERGQEDATLSRLCRAEVNLGAVVGEVKDGNCHMAFEGVEIIRPEFEVLTRDGQ